jgi:O-Antigen ligase
MQTADLSVEVMIQQIKVLILIIGIACIPSIGQSIALGILILVACGDRTWTLKSLMMGTIVTFVNPSFASTGFGTSVVLSILKWILLFVCLARSLQSPVEPTKEYRRLFVLWFVAAMVLLANSVFVSDLPKVSAFKAISFSLGVLCAIRLGMVAAHRRDELMLFIATSGTTIFLASVPLLPFAVGHSVNGSGFNGLLSHPQGLGIFLVMTGSAAFATALKAPRLRRLLITAGLAQWSMIYFTRSRTAFVAICLGGIVYVVEFVVRNERENRLKYFSLPLAILLIAGLLLVVVVSPGVRSGVVAFLEKGHDDSFDLFDDPEYAVGASSRGSQIADGLELAEEHPLFGAGFGVDQDSESDMAINGAQWEGIPLSAPVEQGFLPIATVAQIGFVGSAFVFAFLFYIYRLARPDSGETAALFAAVVGVNFGEMIFYSTGGWGIVMWVLLLLFASTGAVSQQANASRA